MTTRACLVLCLGLCTAIPGEESVEFSSARARKARETHEKALERLKAEYDSKVQKAGEEYRKALEGALKDVRKKDKDEAARIEKAIEGLKLQAPGGKQAAKTGPAEAIGGYTFTGGDGSSIEKAVVIHGAEDSAGAVEAQGHWLGKHLAGFRKVGQALLEKGDRIYDEIKLTAPDGKERSIFFDITTCFGLPKADREDR